MGIKLETILEKIFFVISILIFAFLTAFSFVFSFENVELANQNVLFHRDSIVFNILILAVLLTLFFFQKRTIEKRHINTKLVALIIAIVCAGISLYWVLTSGTAPRSDNLAICECASAILKGDYSCFAKGEYLGRFPHQVGLATVMRIVFALFGDMNYTAFRVINALGIFILVYCGYVITRIISDNNTFAEITYLEIMLLCLPMYLYTDFVYGESMSISLMVASFALVLLLLQKQAVLKFVGLFATVFLAMLYRKNSIVMYIAIIGVMVIKLFVEKNKKLVIGIMVVVVAAIASRNLLLNGLYNDKIPSDSEGVPNILYIAMGTNTSENFAGWYDGSVLVISYENDFDAEKSARDGKEILAAFLDKCIHDPKFAVTFYTKKITSQWSAPMYQCIVMNDYIVGPQTILAKSIYNENNWKYLDVFMNIYQLVIYGGVLAFLVFEIKRLKGLQYYIGLIAVFGGFLFSIIWEAKCRYVFPYFMLMMPFAAVGIYLLLNKVGQKKE